MRGSTYTYARVSPQAYRDLLALPDGGRSADPPADLERLMEMMAPEVRGRYVRLS